MALWTGPGAGCFAAGLPRPRSGVAGSGPSRTTSGGSTRPSPRSPVLPARRLGQRGELPTLALTCRLPVGAASTGRTPGLARFPSIARCPAAAPAHRPPCRSRLGLGWPEV